MSSHLESLPSQYCVHPLWELADGLQQVVLINLKLLRLPRERSHKIQALSKTATHLEPEDDANACDVSKRAMSKNIHCRETCQEQNASYRQSSHVAAAKVPNESSSAHTAGLIYRCHTCGVASLEACCIGVVDELQAGSRSLLHGRRQSEASGDQECNGAADDDLQRPECEKEPLDWDREVLMSG